jgi:hypothetical protein
MKASLQEHAKNIKSNVWNSLTPKRWQIGNLFVCLFVCFCAFSISSYVSNHLNSATGLWITLCVYIFINCTVRTLHSLASTMTFYIVPLITSATISTSGKIFFNTLAFSGTSYRLPFCRVNLKSLTLSEFELFTFPVSNGHLPIVKTVKWNSYTSST